MSKRMDGFMEETQKLGSNASELIGLGLLAGPTATGIVSPKTEKKHHRILQGMDLAGLGLLAAPYAKAMLHAKKG